MWNPTLASRLLLVAAGLCGALGVAAAARASHAGDDNLGIAANFLLLHAPVLIGLSLMARSRLVLAAGWCCWSGWCCSPAISRRARCWAVRCSRWPPRSAAAG